MVDVRKSDLERYLRFICVLPDYLLEYTFPKTILNSKQRLRIPAPLGNLQHAYFNACYCNYKILVFTCHVM